MNCNKNMTKQELKDYGNTLNIKVNLRHSKEQIIKQLNFAQKNNLQTNKTATKEKIIDTATNSNENNTNKTIIAIIIILLLLGIGFILAYQ